MDMRTGTNDGSGHKRPLIEKKKKKGLELLLSKNIASNTTVSGRRYN